MTEAVAGSVKDMLTDRKIAVLCILFSGLFWVLVMGNSKGDVEGLLTTVGVNLDAVKMYINGNCAFMWISYPSLFFSSITVVGINFPFRKHQYRWYLLVVFFITLLVWSYGWGAGILGIFSVLAGIYISFEVMYSRIRGKVSGNITPYEDIQETRREYKIGDINKKVSESKSVLKKKVLEVEPKKSEYRRKYNILFPSNSHIEKVEKGESGSSEELRVVKKIHLIPISYLFHATILVAGLGIIVGITSFVIPPSKENGIEI